MPGLKQKTIAGLKWSAIERFATQGIGFAISIVIARILSPSDYGLIGMISIFIAVSNVFVGAGFGSALIRKQDRTEADCSTVFYYNILVSTLFYFLLFMAAPRIADFYHTPELTTITRVVGLNIIIGAFGAIQSTKLSIAIDFKTQAKISLIVVVITGGVGLAMAYKGFGVWALVIQGLASAILTSLLLWYFVRWKPLWTFSVSSFKELFGFGSKLMLSGLLDTIYSNIYQLIIGKKYLAVDLGYYTRAVGLVQLPSSNITGIIQRVTFPVLSEIQHDAERLKKNYRRLLKMSAFIIFPVMVLLAALGKPLVILLLTEKWLPAVPLMQVLCFSAMFYPIHAINLNLLQVKGRSDLFLRLEIIKKILITLVLFVSVPFGVLAMCYGTIFTSLVALIINTYYTGKLIRHGFFDQMKDIVPVLVLSLLAGLAAFLPTLFFKGNLIQILIGGIAGGGIFLGAGYLFKLQEMSEIKAILLKQ
jgi:O-antigen/teichoic acid export membrane protein